VKAVAVDDMTPSSFDERPVAVIPRSAPAPRRAWFAAARAGTIGGCLRRLKFAGHEIDVGRRGSNRRLCVKRLADIDLTRALASDVLRDTDRDAPSSSQCRADAPPARISRDGTVGVACKLQELFGLAETPRIGRRREPSCCRCSPERPASAGDARSAQLLGSHLPGGEERTAWALSEAPVPEDPWRAPPTSKLKPKG
jgi:ATP-dependent helicase HrpB